MNKVKICANCQNSVAENSNFCSSCGTKYVEPKIKSTPKPKPSQSADKSSSAANDNIKLIAGIVVGLLIGGIAGLALIDDGSTTISSLELGIGALESEKNQLVSEKDRLLSEKGQLSSDIIILSAELERVKEFEGKVSELELSLQTANNEKSELNTQLSQINDEKDSLETQVLDLDGQITELNAEIQELNNKVAEGNQEILDLNAEVAEGNQEILDLNAEVLKASQANAMITSLELEVSALERLKNSLQIQINNLNARISILENSVADKDALIASHENTIDAWISHNLNLHESVIATDSNIDIPVGQCWNVNLYVLQQADATLYNDMINYNGYLVLDYTSTQTMSIYVHDNDGWWTNVPEKASDVLYIPHTPDTIVVADQADMWYLQMCSNDGQATLAYTLSFKF